MSVRQKNNKMLKRIQHFGIPINSRWEISDVWIVVKEVDISLFKTKPRPVPYRKCHIFDLNELDKVKHLII